jgi:membrane protease YdiL (CAAX protease family)
VTPATRQDGLELAAALAAAVLHALPLERFYPEVIEIALVVAGWVGYLGFLLTRDRPRLRAMGFSRAGLAPSATAAFAIFGVATAGMAAWGLAAGTLRLDLHMLILVALYPLWGLVQQWLIQGVVARQLRARAPAWATVLATATVFGVLHFPDTLAAVATFVLGLALTPVYLRWRNVWALGVVHGWLAIPMYFWVAGVDPWAAALGG